MPTRRNRNRFVVCLSNEGWKASLEARKLYVALKDLAAEKHGLIRVIDESGESYLYPKRCFAPIAVTGQLEKALAAGP